MAERLWYVAHTRPRREKKVAAYCQRQGIPVTLPCYESAHKYRGKTVVFEKPLFPGYVFLRLPAAQVEGVRRNDDVANVLTVHDQQTFEQQLNDILLALEAKLDVRLAATVQEGNRVRIRSGPLQGLEGLVEKRSGITTVFLRLDFINQAAAVKVDASQVEVI